MTRVLHTGDTHLGYQQYHVPDRRQDFLDAFRQVAADAIEDDVDAVVHAGDLFHDRRPTLPDILGAIDVLEELASNDVPFVAIVGNHEGKRDAQWLDLFETLGLATRLGAEPIEVGDVALYGLDFVPRSQRDAYEPSFEPHDAEHAALVAHGLFEPFDLGEWDPAEIIEPADVEFDALLLGDNHDPGTAEVEDTWITYCGSTERASADERDPRGYNLVTFDGEVEIARRGLETREFVFVEFDLAAEEGLQRIRDRVGQHHLAGAVVVVHLDGEGEPIAPAAIEEFALEEGALVARVTDHRERDEEGTPDVSFADPDEAVRERVRELGLSDAARDLDETIRASKVPDSRVADTVEDRVEELLEDGAETFQRAQPEEGNNGSSESTADADPGSSVAAADHDAAEPGTETGEQRDDADEDPPEDGAGETTAAPSADGPEASQTESEPAEGSPESSQNDADGQSSMEEFL